MGGNAFKEPLRPITIQEIYGSDGMTASIFAPATDDFGVVIPTPDGNGMFDIISYASGIPVDEIKNSALGSVGKKNISGDIDIVVDATKYDIEEILKRLKTTIGEDSINTKAIGLHQIFTRMSIAGNYKTSINGNHADHVQVDFLFGNPKLLKWTYHSPKQDESLYKGTVRNAMLRSLVANKRFLPRQGWSKYASEGRLVASAGPAYTLDRGIIWGYRHSVNAKGDAFTKGSKRLKDEESQLFLEQVGKMWDDITESDIRTGYFTSDTPEGIAEYIFGSGSDPLSLNTFENIYETLMASDYDVEYKQRVLADAKDELVRKVGMQSGLTIPPELENVNVR